MIKEQKNILKRDKEKNDKKIRILLKIKIKKQKAF